MAIIKYQSFAGEIPRMEPHLLPEINAQQAINCDFTRGSLRPLKGGTPLRSMSSSPVRGIYTEDGLQFYSWPTETYAFRGPVIGDTYGRMYFLQPGGKFKVATKAQMASNGPTPSGNVWDVGVPAPTDAPELVIIERLGLPDYETIGLYCEAWWEFDGKAYGKAIVEMITDLSLRNYHFTPPEFIKQKATTKADTTTTTSSQSNVDTLQQVLLTEGAQDATDVTASINAVDNGTSTVSSQSESTVEDSIEGYPNGSVLTLRFRLLDQGNQSREIFSFVVKSGSTIRNNSLPGGFEVTMNNTDDRADVTFVWGVAETRAYVYTNRNTWDEESAPSPAALVSVSYVQDVGLRVKPVSFAGYRPQKDVQVYRTYGTSKNLIRTQVSTAPLANSFLDYSRKPDPQAKVLESQDWVVPPNVLQGAARLSNGWFAAFNENTLYMSEPFRPHAWPYTITFPASIRGICVAQQSMVVTTAEGVHLVTGAVPSSANEIKLNQPQPGISQRSMVGIDGAVAYASNDGIVVVTGTTASIEASQRLFTREKWRELFGTILADGSIRLSYHDGYLVVTSNTTETGFLLRLDEAGGSYTRINEKFDSTFFLPVTDTLYYASGSELFSFNSGSYKALDWWSRDFIYRDFAVFGAGFIRCDGPVTMTVYADGQQFYEREIPASGHFRLPDVGTNATGGAVNSRALRWSVRLRSSAPIYEFYLAQTMRELKLA